MSDHTELSIELVELLDEIGMEFALHTHHPLTHLELNDAATSELQARTRCSGGIGVG
jgi:hypothetical protein